MKTITKIVIIAGLCSSFAYASTNNEREITFYKQQISTLQKIADRYNTILSQANSKQKKAAYHAMSNLSKTIKMFKNKAKRTEGN